jgi:hypothetical protein
MNYLNRRTQIVKVKQHRSSEMNVTTGVPQCSILSLVHYYFFYTLMTLGTVVKLFLSFYNYADDTNAFYSNSCLKTLSSTIQNELDKVVQWLNANKLSISASKTKIVIFKCKNKSQDSQITNKNK